jgi:hypothetical protein
MSKIEGIVKTIMQPKQVKDATVNGFVIEVQDGQYSNLVAFEGYKKEIPNSVKVGQKVEVYYNLRSREHNGNWYTSASFWKVEAISDQMNLDSGWRGGKDDGLAF